MFEPVGRALAELGRAPRVPGAAELFWLHVLPDTAIALSCLAIAATITALVRRLGHGRPSRAPLVAGAFVATTALLYLVDAWAPWWQAPAADVALRVAAAAAAVGAALSLPSFLPRAAEIARAGSLLHLRGLELAAAHRELAAAVAKAKGLETQLFANVSHELRTPLALILGPTERLLTDPGLTAVQRADLEVVARNARSLLKHVGDLLDVAKGDAGRLEAYYAEVDLADLVRTTAGYFDAFAADRRIHYTVDAPAPIPAELDAGKLQRALVNLLSNAFKFTPVGGAVRVSARALPEGRVVVEVADSGPGVPPSARQAVFERFRQLEQGVTRRFGGTGLGLAIVKDFVELLAGAVVIDDAPEGGALLRVELPAHAPPGTPVASGEDSAVMFRAMVREALDSLREPEEAPPPTPRPSLPLVLVVEDNPDMNRFVARTLSPDFRVVTALDGRKGLEKAIALKPDLIVSDVMMPGLSGEALLAEVRARPELDGVPVVVLTAKTDDALRTRLLREGAQDYLNKPFHAEELCARVGNLVTLKRARDILQRDLTTRTRDLEALAREVAQRRRELSTALDSACVARDHADRASAMKTSFLRMVSHELRTPLTSLKLNLERLQRSRDASLSPRQLDMLRKIHGSTVRLHELIESLLEYARIEGGRLRVAVEPFDARAPASLEGVERGTFVFSSWASKLVLRGDAGMAELYRAQFKGTVPEVRVDGGTVTVRYPRRLRTLFGSNQEAEIALNAAVPWRIELRNGASDTTADMHGLILVGLEIRGGASSVTVELPAPAGTVPVKIAGGASGITINRPPGVEVSIRVKGWAAHLTFDDQTFDAIGSDSRLQSPGYADAARRYDIEVAGSASGITVTTSA